MEEVKNFLNTIHPFDTLTPQQLDLLVSHTDIGYYQEGEEIVLNRFFIIIKGSAQEIQEDNVVEIYHEKDFFDIQALLGKKDAHFVAVEETLLYEIDKETFLEVFHKNSTFKQYFFQTISQKIDKLKEQKSLSQVGDLLSAKLEDIPLTPLYKVEASTPIKDAVKNMQHLLLVQKGNLEGVVTSSDLKKVILHAIDFATPIESIATFPAITIQYDDFLFNALLLMTSKNIKHLIVKKENTSIGSVEIGDLLSFFSNQSYLLARKVERADSTEDLKYVTDKFIQMVEILYHKGIKTRYLAKLVSELNEKVYKKVYDLTFGIDGTFLLLGSQGRGEQLLRTDQDNAFIVKNPADKQAALKKAEEFVAALELLGYPRCKGNIMLNNPQWNKTTKEWEETLLSWIEHPNETNMMYMSIFLDAKAVYGNQEQFENLKRILFDHVSDNAGFLSQMARPVMQFENPLNMFGFFRKARTIDLKKGGIFAVVHGVRVLALQYHIHNTNTVERLKEISNLGILEKSFVTDLIESFETLNSFRLRASLHNIQKGLDATNSIDVTTLNKLERDILKESFKTIEKFKEFLSYHYKLSMVS
ncbi:putative nucleotidyltransferase substrate binding domain-containing protein [Nitratiruptor sp. SB155-2]|uniref:putative nucleotidyltransferase substrate binding domain-containing protein n=1 Tax=Nitratiruptor sp. (strain SB155-2) TaxID=387092 RepID=UPI0001586D03|nr:putative nucleotidyltransferase substrate binding domain-containing protein [Nitratiruptor sp. SB155-2]BAF69637.1 cyclic nucleotide binding protein [Nitratiruptor sp. SB155-2]